MTQLSAAKTSLVEDMVSATSADAVADDAASRAYFASDLFEKGLEPDVIVAPRTTQEVADIVKSARTHGRAVYIRGGGMSYSNAYQPARENAVMLDMRHISAVRDINAQDLTVTVEAGCTWRMLDQALGPLGLRATFWGPMSGRKASIGGGLSQGSANHASSKVGTSDAAVLSYEVVTGAGDILVTGKDAQDGHLPFTRNYGPDLTSLFSNDAGALGIKTAATLRLEPIPAAAGGVSFAFDSFAQVRAAMQAAARSGLTISIVAIDAETAGLRAGPRGFKADLEKLWSIVRTAHNPLRGVIRGTQIALAGGKVFERAQFTAHFIAEGQTTAELAAKEAHLRSLIKPHGQEIPNAAISLMRMDNFPDLGMAHMDGRRMLPIHGILPYSAVSAFDSDYRNRIASYRQRMDALDIILADVYFAINTNAVLCEPVFYWPDSHTHYHKAMTSEAVQANWSEAADNPEARALVREMRDAIVDLHYKHGAAHLQIGKVYPYMRGRADTNAAFVKALKAELDPDGIISPGALGL